MKNSIQIFSPATVANVACGFDILGFCLDMVGDKMIISKTKERRIKITKITGAELPLETTKNVAGVSALALFEDLKPNCGFDIEIYKRISPGSGIGSSAASAAGSVFAINELLGNPLNKAELTKYAIKGEFLASQSEHADNIAPVLFGGFTLVKSLHPLEILQIPFPQDLFVTILHPQIEIKTAEARELLPKKVDLKKVITQSANLGSLIHALHTGDYPLLKHSLKDAIIEPLRKKLIPNYDLLKNIALTNGALGCSISGSGPSIFALCHGEDTALKVQQAFMTFMENHTKIDYNAFISGINTDGIKIL